VLVIVVVIFPTAR